MISPSIIITVKMNNLTPHELVNIKICNLIRNQLQLLNKNYDLMSPIQDLIHEIFHNIYMAILVGKDSYVSTFKLLYQVQKKIQYSRYKDIPCSKLYSWFGEQKMVQFLMNKIRQVVQLETKYSFKKQIYIQNEISNEKNLRNQTKIAQEKIPEKSKENKEINSSPSTAVNSHQQHESVSFQHHADNCSHENQQDSDLFQILSLNQDCVTPFEEKMKELSCNYMQNEEKIICEEGELKNEGDFSEEKIEVKRKSSESAHHGQESQENPFTVIKMTTKELNMEDEDNLMSEVSSLAESNYFTIMGSYQLEDTSKYGHFLYGDKVDKILKILNTKSTILVMVKWLPRKNGTVPVDSVLESSVLKQHCPKILMEFYEKQLK